MFLPAPVDIVPVSEGKQSIADDAIGLLFPSPSS